MVPRPFICLLAALVWPGFAAESVTNSPPVSTNLPLRRMVVAPLDFGNLPLPDTPAVAVQMPMVRTVADAQAAVLRAPEDWRGWASLSRAHYKAGNYEKAHTAAIQMRSAATARNEPLPLAADELFERCRRAAEALAILE